MSKAENLVKLKELLDAGALTQEEFETEKQKVLNSIGSVSEQNPTTMGNDTGREPEMTLVWFLAFALVIGAFLQGFMAEILNVYYDQLWWVTLGVNIGFTVADLNKLKRDGFDVPSELQNSVWLVPVYLYQRCRLYKQSEAPFYVWIVLFVLSLAGYL